MRLVLRLGCGCVCMQTLGVRKQTEAQAQGKVSADGQSGKSSKLSVRDCQNEPRTPDYARRWKGPIDRLTNATDAARGLRPQAT
jgi:hypothetical protein